MYFRPCRVGGCPYGQKAFGCRAQEAFRLVQPATIPFDEAFDGEEHTSCEQAPASLAGVFLSLADGLSGCCPPRRPSPGDRDLRVAFSHEIRFEPRGNGTLLNLLSRKKRESSPLLGFERWRDSACLRKKASHEAFMVLRPIANQSFTPCLSARPAHVCDRRGCKERSFPGVSVKPKPFQKRRERRLSTPQACAGAPGRREASVKRGDKVQGGEPALFTPQQVKYELSLCPAAAFRFKHRPLFARRMSIRSHFSALFLTEHRRSISKRSVK